MKLGIKTLIGGAALALSIASGSLAALDAHAAYVVCRTDPTVQLSNGMTVTMWAEIGADLSQIQSVSYVLHVPHGAKAKTVTYDQYSSIESLSVVQDQAGNRYQVATTVTTSAPADVTAYATLDRGKTKTTSSNGKSGQKLTITFKS